jgi:alcohol dehydrogenase
MASNVSREFTFFPLEKVLSGVGTRSRLPRQVERLGGQRAFILTGRTLAHETDLVRELEGMLGQRWAGTFAGCLPHCPSGTVEEAAQRAGEAEADLLVGFGGGTPITTAKLVAATLLGDRPQGALPQIALPTTLSASEFTPAGGMTDEKTRVKRAQVDSRIIPRVVILDPELTLATPARLWASTGIKALDHALEALWSRRPHPLTDALALEAIRTLVRHLPASLDPGNLDARGQCQQAAWMSIFGMINVGTRLSHPLGHQIGARWNVPHGITSCIVLPHVMRYLAPSTLDVQVRIAAAFGIETGERSAEQLAGQAAEALQDLIDALGVSTRLSATGASRVELPDVARAVAEEIGAVGGAAPAESDLLGLLEAMW